MILVVDEKVETQLVVVAEEEEILVVAVMVVGAAVAIEVVAFKSCYCTFFGIRE